MRSHLIVAAFFAITSAAPSHSAQRPVTTLDETYDVPGDNPLHFCQDPSTENYILTIDNVDLDPNPPAAGQNLTITAKGDLEQDIEDGAKVHLQIKYGLITIIKQTADLCDAVKNVDLECPLKKGPLKLTKDVALPSQIPPGKYTVLADVYTKDDAKITCLNAQVEFHRSKTVTQALGLDRFDM